MGRRWNSDEHELEERRGKREGCKGGMEGKGWCEDRKCIGSERKVSHREMWMERQVKGIDLHKAGSRTDSVAELSG